MRMSAYLNPSWGGGAVAQRAGAARGDDAVGPGLPRQLPNLCSQSSRRGSGVEDLVTVLSGRMAANPDPDVAPSVHWSTAWDGYATWSRHCGPAAPSR
jgi:hypothetical protein